MNIYNKHLTKIKKFYVKCLIWTMILRQKYAFKLIRQVIEMDLALRLVQEPVSRVLVDVVRADRRDRGADVRLRLVEQEVVQDRRGAEEQHKQRGIEQRGLFLLPPDPPSSYARAPRTGADLTVGVVSVWFPAVSVRCHVSFDPLPSAATLPRDPLADYTILPRRAGRTVSALSQFVLICRKAARTRSGLPRRFAEIPYGQTQDPVIQCV